MMSDLLYCSMLLDDLRIGLQSMLTRKKKKKKGTDWTLENSETRVNISEKLLPIIWLLHWIRNGSTTEAVYSSQTPRHIKLTVSKKNAKGKSLQLLLWGSDVPVEFGDLVLHSSAFYPAFKSLLSAAWRRIRYKQAEIDSMAHTAAVKETAKHSSLV